MATDLKPIPNEYTRFLAKLHIPEFSPDCCWEWRGAGKGNGYGNINFRGRTMPAHRASYILFRGPVSEYLDVCHTCDNRACVNPDHLFLGTRAENMQDAKQKGRTHRPGKHLTRQQVLDVAARLNSGHSPRLIASSMSISYEVITSIRSGRAYSKYTGKEKTNGR